MKFSVFRTIQNIETEQIPEKNLGKTSVQERAAKEIITREYVEGKTTITGTSSPI